MNILIQNTQKDDNVLKMMMSELEFLRSCLSSKEKELETVKRTLLLQETKNTSLR